MKIYFCDICNQSIPLKDMDQGLAVAVQGKMVCASCAASTLHATKGGTDGAAPAAGAAPSAPAAAAAPVGGKILLGVVFALVGSAAFTSWMLENRAKQWKDAVDGVRKTSEKGLSAHEDKMQILQTESQAAKAGFESLAVELRRVDEEQQGRRTHDQAELATRFETVQSYVRENEKLKEEVQQLRVQLAAADQSAQQTQRELTSVKASLQDLAAKAAAAAVVSANQPGASSNGGAAPGGNPDDGALPQLPNELQKHLADLKSNDSGKRWEAVSVLSVGNNEKVIPYLIPMLKDGDEFVREHVAQVLGDMNARAAIPFLIDALADDQQFVRDSVFAQLRRITNKNDIKFDSGGKADDRARQQKLWRAWWDQQKDKK